MILSGHYYYHTAPHLLQRRSHFRGHHSALQWPKQLGTSDLRACLAELVT